MKIRLNENALPRSKDVKCLEVWIDDCLTWKRHIDFVRTKCFHGLARIRRLESVLPTSIKTKLYNALVLPHLDYCSVVWHECTKDLQRKKVEWIQNYGMRLILSKPPRIPSEEARLRLKWLSLVERQRINRLSLVHRYTNGGGPRCVTSMIQTNKVAGCRSMRGWKKLHVLPARTAFYGKSFTCRGTHNWNLLPSDIRTIKSGNIFK